MLQVIVDWLVYSVLKFTPESKLGGVVDFFIYDSIKIILLLFGMITAIGFLRTFIPQQKLRGWLSSKKSSYLYASIFGAVTPFCSCSSIPIFISFLRAGIPLGVAFSFLITSPLINEYLIVLMLGFFGGEITAAYVLSGILIGVVIGAILGALHLEKYLVTDLTEGTLASEKSFHGGMLKRIAFGLNEAKSIVHKIWVWVLVGVGVGAIIHNYIPQEAIQSILNKAGIFSVPIATLLGVPMYGSCAAIVPIAVVLFQKGVPIGTALAFTMAIVGLSLPEAIMLRRVIRLPLIAIFFGVTTLAIIFTGYLFNFLF